MTPAAPLVITLRILVATCPAPDAPALRAADGSGPVDVGQPVRASAWIDQHVRAAQEVMAPHDITIAAKTIAFSPASCDALDAAARHAFARHVPSPAASAGAVTVLVVRRVRDLDVSDYDLHGVHWRYRGPDPELAGRRWVFLTARARPPVLAHELCHFFGLPHDPAGGNLMTPGPSSPAWKRARKPRPFAPILTPAQVRRLRAGVRKWQGQGASDSDGGRKRP